MSVLAKSLLLVLVGIAAVSDAQRNNPSPSPSPSPDPVPYDPGYGPTYGRSQQSIADALENIAAEVERLQTIEDQQNARLDLLSESANVNLEFADNFNDFPLGEIEFEQHQQNARLDQLQARLEEISALRHLVDSLNAAADDVPESINEALELFEQVPRADRTDIRIPEIEARLDAVEDSLDDIFADAADDRNSLDAAELNVRRLIYTINREATANDVLELVIPPGSRTLEASLIFPQALAGVLQVNSITPTGFVVRRSPTYAGYTYPTIYFSVSVEPSNDRLDVFVRDRSEGGWRLERIQAVQRVRHFHDTPYPKSFLDQI